MAPRIAIVGAGVTGLVAARELARNGASVEVFERWPDVGGQASAFDLGGGVWLERYYHHLFASDRDMIGLYDELLPGELEWFPSTVAMYAEGAFWPFVTPLDLLRYGPLSPLDRVRLGACTLRLVRASAAREADRTPAIEWLRASCGERAVEGVWRPLLLRKFGEDAAGVPLAWLRSKLLLRRQHLDGAGAAGERLGYPRGSFRRICVALADEIRARGGAVHLDREVVRVEREAGGFVLRCAAPGAYRTALASPAVDTARAAPADAVLVTVGTRAALGMAPWPAPFAERLREWRYRTAVVLLLELRERFSGAYWTNVVDPASPFLGLIEHTNLVPAERYPARYLYVSNYVADGDPLTRATADELLAGYLPALARMHAGFGERDVLRRWSFREEFAQPVPVLEQRSRILPFVTPIERLFVANTTQIYPEDRGTNYSVRLGREAARAVRERLGPYSPTNF